MTTSNTPYAELVKRLDEKATPLCNGAARAIEALEAEVDRLSNGPVQRDLDGNAVQLVGGQWMSPRSAADADRRVEEEREVIAKWHDEQAAEYHERYRTHSWAMDSTRSLTHIESASAIRSRSNSTGEDKDGLTAPATGRSPISQEGSIAPEALSAGWAPKLADALENIDMQAVPGPTQDWVMIPKVEWDSIGATALLKDYAAALSASPTPPQWQPIETADKSKEIVALAIDWDHGKSPIVLSWFKYNGAEAWRSGDGDAYTPSHYLPLPPTPNAAELTGSPQTVGGGECTAERGAVSGQDSEVSNCALEPTGAGASLSGASLSDGGE